MAIPKVMGTEIEYGITVKNDRDFDPISSCVLLVNAPRVQLRKSANRREIVRRAFQHGLQLAMSLEMLPEIQQRASESDPSGQVVGMDLEPFSAERHRTVDLTGASEALRNNTERGRDEGSGCDGGVHGGPRG